jgi:FixJ family two-component response regulator
MSKVQRWSGRYGLGEEELEPGSARLSAARNNGKCDLNCTAALISIIEDDGPVLKSLSRLIRAAGYGVAHFRSAEEFLKCKKYADTACVILDQGLPGMSGLELQVRLAAENSRVPVIFVSAHDEPEIRSRAIENSAIAFICKPFSAESLFSAIRSALNK